MKAVPSHILVTQSNLDSVPSGKVYPVIKWKGQAFIYNYLGLRTLLDEQSFKWKPTDKVVMMVKVVSSRLETIKSGNIYPVFDDKKDDERYVIDEAGGMVLFDQSIFKWEIL